MSARARINCPKCGEEIQIYKSPAPTVDAVLFTPERGILLVERKFEPLGWALPGGFVDYGEQLDVAIVREMKEELSLDTEIVKMFGVYSEPERDPRGHVISVVYILKSDGIPVAKDDAKAIKIIGLNNFENFDFVFDHKKIIKDYVLSLI